MNKLSELSKPTACRNKHTGRTFNATENTEPQIYESLYSQEYVSALDGVAQFWIGESAGWKKRAEDAEKRIAELERANQSQDDHINQQQDRIDSLEKTNGDLGRSLGAAEKRLATPVRLPDIRSDDYHETGWFQHMKYYRDVERSILAAGFAVGD